MNQQLSRLILFCASGVFISLLWFSFGSCRKEIPFLKDPAARLTFSEDTVIFDTVFSTIGSVTKQLKVYNNYSKRLKISRIMLAGGGNSQYRLNIDGVPGNMALDIELMPKDSLFIFIEVTVNPTLQNAPLIVADSILFEVNGNMQDVDLVAWGQDAHYIRPNTFIQGFPPLNIFCGVNETFTFTNDKPWVIYGYAAVDSLGTLIVEPGARVHFHNSSGLWIYRFAKIIANGTKEQPITFQGDRLDPPYRNIPGQWDRILINEGAKSEFNHVNIRNGFIGIQADVFSGRAVNDNTQIIIQNTRIQNMAGIGILATFFKIRASNLLVANCKEQTLAITMGGSYSFRHCTFANYWSGNIRQSPSIILNNYNSVQTLPMDSAYFANCILYGNIENELSLDSKAGENFNYNFDHCVMKLGSSIVTTDPVRFINLVKNPPFIVVNGLQTDPIFKDPSKQEYQLKENSAALDKGNPIFSQQVPIDIEGVLRGNPPDVGAFEFQ
jgi:hypothetical protein